MASPSFPLPLRLAVLALLVGGASGAALAQTSPAGPARLTPAQQQRVFPDQKRLALEGYRTRIGILQTAQSCTGAATTSDALMNCRRQERQAYQQMRQRHQTEMRAVYQRNNIPVPDKGSGWGGKQQGNR